MNDTPATVSEALAHAGPRNAPLRHPSSERFHQLLAALGELHDRKSADYGQDDDPLANVRSSEEWGIPGWVGALVRLNDKLRRCQALALKGELLNESVLDSLDDIAVYAVIARVLYEQDAVAAWREEAHPRV